MGNLKNNPFDVKLVPDNIYYRLYISHPNFKGRIRKRLGKGEFDVMENLAFNLKFELGKYFQIRDISKNDVENFTENYISINVKGNASIFNYSNEFLELKAKKFNKNTRKPITKSTLSGYRTTLKYFEKYLTKEKIPPHPSQISNEVLDNYNSFIEGGHNYKCKLHTKLKGFIIFIEEVKHLPINPSYKLSNFAEEYDNQSPEEDDIALTEEDVRKLIGLRIKFLNGEVTLDAYKVSDKIPIAVQQQQFKMKEDNVKKCLDCFLFMISIGMYHADIMKTELHFSKDGTAMHARYRRAKTGGLCKAIPINNDDIFIAEEIINEYMIKNGSNFPLNLSLTHFAKHLDLIGSLAGLDYKINNKMARKTFASILFFKRRLPIHLLQILLGHKDVKDTQHYLRISDNDVASEIRKWTSPQASKE